MYACVRAGASSQEPGLLRGGVIVHRYARKGRRVGLLQVPVRQPEPSAPFTGDHVAVLLLPQSVRIATGSSGAAATADAGQVALVISCEHGGNRIPETYQPLFATHQALLRTHRGYDPGALVMARELAACFQVPLVAATTSRLLVDLNRSAHHPRLHLDAVRSAPAAVRQEILEHHYYPYRNELEDRVRQGIARCSRVLHLSVHSFTPELSGQVRNADVGLLYDPARAGEKALCQVWKQRLTQSAPTLRVRRNYPYAGRGDGLTRYFRQCFSPSQYIGVELELNQARAAGPVAVAQALRMAVIHSLQHCLQRVAPQPLAVAANPHKLFL